MSYLALYRKYRPYTFNDVVGQQHIVQTLTNQIKSNRVAHAYLFTGTRGTGKTSIAKIFSRAVNCDTPINGSACGKCATCQSVADGASINIIEIDAASHNGVDNIREINEEVRYTPSVGKYKVYIIDEVHMLSTGAFNALLKTLEEPPAHVIFILATTDPQKIPITILSRCQRFDFKRLTANEIEDRLREYCTKENLDIESSALAYIARLADGGMRDALSILEQCISFYYNQTITLDKVLYLVGAVDSSILFKLISAISTKNTESALSIVDEVNLQGRNLRQFATDILSHCRNLLVAKTTHGSVKVLDCSKEYIGKLEEQSADISKEELLRYMKAFSQLEYELRIALSPKVLFEISLVKLCEIDMDNSLEALMSEMSTMKEKMASILSGQAISTTKAATSNQPSRAVSTNTTTKATISHEISATKVTSEKVESPVESDKTISPFVTENEEATEIKVPNEAPKAIHSQDLLAKIIESWDDMLAVIPAYALKDVFLETAVTVLNGALFVTYKGYMAGVIQRYRKDFQAHINQFFGSDISINYISEQELQKKCAITSNKAQQIAKEVLEIVDAEDDAEDTLTETTEEDLDNEEKVIEETHVKKDSKGDSKPKQSTNDKGSKTSSKVKQSTTNKETSSKQSSFFSSDQMSFLFEE